jgi:hypothetical protein
VFKLDAVMLRTPDPNPPQEPAYLREVSGTSIAAPFVAAYVGMLRLACDRMGVAYSRARALAGVDTEAALAGKVSTGGRLDIYKGLRFYLETLPELLVEDSTRTEWKAGQRMEYSLSIDPAPGQAYAFSALGLPDGTGIDGAGKLVWTPTEAQAGEYTLRFKAEGPTTLRKMLQVKIESLAPVPLAHVPFRPAGWEIGGLRYRLPPGTEFGRHLVEIAAVDAAGRTATVFRGWMESPASRRAPVGRGPGLEVFRTWRISVDGMPLRAER